MAKSSKSTKETKKTKSSKLTKMNKPATDIVKASNAVVEPGDVVRAFIAAMHDWEKFAAKTITDATRKGENGFDPKYGIQAAQAAVFQQFCTPKPRPYGRQSSFSKPPEYQPEHETILEVTLATSRRAEVHTQQGTGFKHRRNYILLLRNGKWLIDSVKWQEFDGKWSNGVL
jgi:hypothetical protein